MIAVPVYMASTVSKFDSRVWKTAEPVSGAVHEYQTDLSGIDPWFGSPGSPVDRAVLAEVLPVAPVRTVGDAKLSLTGEFWAYWSENGPCADAKPSTAIRYVVPAAALKLTFDCRVPLKSSFEATDASVPKLLPVNTWSVVSNAASRRLKLVGPLSGAVQEYQTEVSAGLPAIDGSPVWPVASVLLPNTVPSAPLIPDPAKLSLLGRPTSPLTKVRRAP